MSETPEFWLFVMANLFVLGPGLVLAALSLAAYRRRGRRELGIAAIGFVCITLGGVGEAVYQLVFRGTFDLAGTELLWLHTVQSLLLGTGLLVLFESLRRY